MTPEELHKAAVAGDLPIVEVEWLDAWGHGEFVESMPTTVPEPSITVGYLIRQDKHGIAIVAYANRSHVTYTLSIPKGMIRRVRKLKR